MTETKAKVLRIELMKNGIESWAVLARRLKLNKATLKNKLDGASDFKWRELATIAEIIGLENMVSIFFGE